MARIITGQTVVTEPTFWLVAQASRVISLCAIVKFEGNAAFAISEPISNPFRVLSVWVRVRWMNLQEGAEIIFRVTTGTGALVDADMVRYWDRVIPCIWEGHEVSWPADVRLYEYHWSLRREFAEQGRRLGVWAYMGLGGMTVANVYASYQIEEG